MASTDDQTTTGTEHTAGRDAFMDLTGNFTQTAQILFAAGGVADTLDQVVKLAVSTIEGCDYAGLFLFEGDAPVTTVYTDPIVELVDSLQHQFTEGPCLNAIAHEHMLYADDLEHDLRWPDFGPQAASSGVRGVLALPLAVNGAQGALILYARYPAAFGVVDRGKGVVLASLASIALSAAHSHETEVRRADNLHTALSTREIIGQAEGILMERERITGDQAFDILRRASQHLNVKLREVAQELIDTGERPDSRRPLPWPRWPELSRRGSWRSRRPPGSS